METKFQTSFIPRKPLVANSSAAPAPQSSGGSGGFLVLVGLVVFGLSVASAIVVFGWEKVEAKKIEENKVTLETARKKFGSDVEVLKKFNDRINLSKQLLANHLSVSNIFEMIADATVDKVRFTSFSFLLPDNPQREKIEVLMKGEANSYASLAYQTDVFGSNSPIKESSVSSLTINDKGNVAFEFDAVIPMDKILYKNQFVAEEAMPATPETPAAEQGLLEETPLQNE